MRPRRRLVGIAIATAGWVLGILGITSGVRISALLPVAVGIAIAIRLVDGTPFWRRAIYWSGIAQAFQAAVAALVIATLLLLSSPHQPELDAPSIPQDATALDEQVRPGVDGLVQRGVLVSVPSFDEEGRVLGGETRQAPETGA